MKKSHHRLTIIFLAVLIAAALIGWFFTMDAGVAVAQRIGKRVAHDKGTTTAGADEQLVDEQPLITAQALQHSLDSSNTIEEKHYADSAVQVADHELDQAYATALRQAAHETKPLTPKQREQSDRIQKLQAKVQSDQQHVDKLMKSAGPQGSGSVEDLPSDLQQQINLAQAQLAMDQDDLDDAKLALARAGGDATSKIQRLLQEHEASEHSVDAAQSASGQNERTPTASEVRKDAAAIEPSHLFGQIRAWMSLQSQKRRIFAAQQQTIKSANGLEQSHQALEEQVKKESGDKTASVVDSGQSAPAGATPTPAPVPVHELAALKQLGDDRKTLAEFGKRIQDEQTLGQIYAHWADFVALRQRALMHRILQSSIVILLIMLTISLINRAIDRMFASLTGDRKRLFNLHGVAIFVMQGTGVALSALVVFGLPSQLPTVIGLAGAGLTVALKDFIVGFIGWFILMGKNGIRVGDWVEIQGVGGEVIEVSLLRTVLMETGNWNDAGHPTGRKVSFVNSYAIEGHYFNFSTAGQWLWDELPVLIPMGISPYEVIDGIQDMVTEETAEAAKLAEVEWHKATELYGVRAFSSAPSIDVRPTTFGIEVTVKYITRANERYDVRGRLNQKVVKLLHEKSVQVGIVPPGQSRKQEPLSPPAGVVQPTIGD